MAYTKQDTLVLQVGGNASRSQPTSQKIICREASKFKRTIMEEAKAHLEL